MVEDFAEHVKEIDKGYESYRRHTVLLELDISKLQSVTQLELDVIKVRKVEMQHRAKLQDESEARVRGRLETTILNKFLIKRTQRTCWVGQLFVWLVVIFN